MNIGKIVDCRCLYDTQDEISYTLFIISESDMKGYILLLYNSSIVFVIC